MATAEPSLSLALQRVLGRLHQAAVGLLGKDVNVLAAQMAIRGCSGSAAAAIGSGKLGRSPLRHG